MNPPSTFHSFLSNVFKSVSDAHRNAGTDDDIFKVLHHVKEKSLSQSYEQNVELLMVAMTIDEKKCTLRDKSQTLERYSRDSYGQTPWMGVTLSNAVTTTMLPQNDKPQ